MRILSLRFMNLNSMVGTWEIDFTDATYQTDGIFAITGPTGAGKSTILDAICLSLYGCTPRLRKLSASENEIMSRQTGQCWAELTFDAAGTQYRCHWAQRKAHSKADGKLQAATHELVRHPDGDIVAKGLKPVAVKIEELTGMSFDQFTRSILLAQGGFAAFLQADANKRAPLLEQLTGTEIYSQISKQVHVMHKARADDVAQLRTRMEAMKLMSPDEETAAIEYRKQIEEKRQTLENSSIELQKSITWRIEQQKQHHELSAVTRDQTQLEKDKTAFATSTVRLENAQRAMELEGQFVALSQARKQHADDETNLKAAELKLPEILQTQSTCLHSVATADQSLQATKTAFQQAEPTIQATRKLDIQIFEKKSPLEQLKSAISKTENVQKELQRTIKAEEMRLDDVSSNLSTWQQERSDREQDALLVEHLSAWTEQAALIGDDAGKLRQLSGSLADHEAKLVSLRHICDEKHQAQKTAAAHVTDLSDQLDNTQSQLNEKLAGQTLPALRREREQNIAAAAQVDQLNGHLTLKAQAMAEHGRLTTEKSRLSKHLEKLAQDLKDVEARHKAAQDKDLLLQTQLVLVSKIESLEAERANLRDGEACPLCGATEHPFATGDLPDVTATEKALTDAKTDLQRLTDHMTELRVETSAVEQRRSQVIADIDREHVRRTQAEAEITQLMGRLALSATSEELTDLIPLKQQETTQRVADLTALCEELEAKETAIEALKADLQQARLTLHANEKAEMEAFVALDTKNNEIINLNKNVNDLETIQNQRLTKLAEELSKSGVNEISQDGLPELMARLKNRRSSWIALVEKIEKHQQDHTRLTQNLAHLTTQIEQEQTRLAEQHAKLETQQAELAALNQQRQVVFGEKSPEIEEKRYKQAIIDAETILEHAKSKRIAADQEVSTTRTLIADLQKRVTLQETSLSQSEQKFAADLQSQKFEDEAAFLSARLPDAERHLLVRHAQQLREREISLMTREEAAQKELTRLNAMAITEESLEALQAQYETLNGEKSTLEKDLGGIIERLKENATRKADQQALLDKIDKRAQDLARWAKLHELIGSADGLKFQRFAQGITFEIVLGHANDQLKKMSSRYILIPDRQMPLDLQVIDAYQAGEIRSTKNLSGGESFIVSLALALGLSQMASQKVQVDSLFLDEGFGTLDDDSLDIALDALSSLQQEGKLIGVISHIAALKERISTQIHVDPAGNGRSRLAGPGCRAVA